MPPILCLEEVVEEEAPYDERKEFSSICIIYFPWESSFLFHQIKTIIDRLIDSKGVVKQYQNIGILL